MMDTIKFPNKGNVKMIAHRGLSGIETENTSAAFVAAGNRSYFGIETDIHLTADGKFIILHLDDTHEVANVVVEAEKTEFQTLRRIRLIDKADGVEREHLLMPTLEEYITLCKRYGKIAVLELKNDMPKEAVWEIAEEIRALGHLESTIFISFSLSNLIALREKYPEQPAQYLVWGLKGEYDALLETLKKHHLDVDVEYTCLTRELAELLHDNGILINVWTVDTLEEVQHMADLGVDFITSNIVE